VTRWLVHDNNVGNNNVGAGLYAILLEKSLTQQQCRSQLVCEESLASLKAMMLGSTIILGMNISHLMTSLLRILCIAHLTTSSLSLRSSSSQGRWLANEVLMIPSYLYWPDHTL